MAIMSNWITTELGLLWLDFYSAASEAREPCKLPTYHRLGGTSLHCPSCGEGQGNWPRGHENHWAGSLKESTWRACVYIGTEVYGHPANCKGHALSLTHFPSRDAFWGQVVMALVRARVAPIGKFATSWAVTDVPASLKDLLLAGAKAIRER